MRIQAAHPDIVWVGIGSPRQEIWMSEHIDRLNVPVLVGVGAAAGGLVQDQINGFIVPEKDAQVLQTALGKILRDESVHDEMSKNALQEVSKWTYRRNVGGYLRGINYVTHR